MDYTILKQRQSYPLEVKITKSIHTIQQFYEMYDGNVYLSTAGADSAVVDWLITQSAYPNIPRYCVGGAEPPENTRLNKQRGDHIIASSKTKKQVVIDYGYPLISKYVAMSLSRYYTGDETAKEKRLNGYQGRKKWVKDGTIPNKYKFLVYSPFLLSEKCCYHIKKAPVKKATKGMFPMTGELAEESNNRLKEYAKHGCIMSDKTQPKCTPIGFWTKQDILECIKKYGIKISPLYGEVIRTEKGLAFSGESRTGCEICGFGILTDPERFERLKKIKPNVYSHMMGGGEWIKKDKYRWVKFRINSIPIWSNRYWVPNNKGYGYRFVLKYIKHGLNQKNK